MLPVDKMADQLTSQGYQPRNFPDTYYAKKLSVQLQTLFALFLTSGVMLLWLF